MMVRGIHLGLMVCRYRPAEGMLVSKHRRVCFFSKLSSPVDSGLFGTGYSADMRMLASCTWTILVRRMGVLPTSRCYTI
jgi:hypothetical protein